MTATDELRRLLAERGVEWMDCGEVSTLIPTQDAVPRAWTVNRWPSSNDMGDCLWVQNRHPLTPAQAVEATLGRGTCRMEPFIYEDTGAFIECSECGWQLFDADYSIDAAREWLGYCPNCGAKVVDA